MNQVWMRVKGLNDALTDRGVEDLRECQGKPASNRQTQPASTSSQP
jgi:hypothetical protein